MGLDTYLIDYIVFCNICPSVSVVIVYLRETRLLPGVSKYIDKIYRNMQSLESVYTRQPLLKEALVSMLL